MLIRQSIGVSIFLFLKELIKPLFASILLSIIYTLISGINMDIMHTIIWIIIGGVIYIGSLFLLRAIDKTDLELIKSFGLPIIGKILR